MTRLLTAALCALMISCPALAQRADQPRAQRGDRLERPDMRPDRARPRGDYNADRGLERRAERFQYRAGRDNRTDRYRYERHRYDRPEVRYRYDRNRAYNDYRYGAGRVYARDRFGYGRGPWYGAPYRVWGPGQYIPRGYWQGGWSPYMIGDWGGYGLHRPPHGHGWVRYHDDLLLIVLANGLVREILRGGWRDRWDRYDDGYYEPPY